MKNKSIMFLVTIGIVLTAVGFGLGTVYQKSKGPLNGMPPNFDRNNPARGRGGLANGGPNSGEITAKDDKSITIKLNSGSMKTIYWIDSTVVSQQQKVTTDDLAVGQKVNIMGKTNSDGSLAADSIILQSE